MAYDSTDFVVTAPVEVPTERANMIRLRDFLKTLPPNKFNMDDPGVSTDAYRGECGSAACIGGWARALFAVHTLSLHRVGDVLGLRDDQSSDLFYPYGREMSDGRSPFRAAPRHAVRVLDHYLATGKIDWSVA